MPLDEYQAHVDAWKLKQNRISLRTARISAALYQIHRADGVIPPEAKDLIDFPEGEDA